MHASFKCQRLSATVRPLTGRRPLSAQELFRVAEATSALSERLAAAGMQASTGIDPLAAVMGEDLQDQIAALRGTFWQGEPLVPLGAPVPVASARTERAAGGIAGGGACLYTGGLMLWQGRPWQQLKSRVSPCEGS